MSVVNLRSSTPFDHAAILEIERACPSAAHWSEEIYRQMWGSPQPDRVGFIAEEEGRIAGFLIAREVAGEWELENIAVATGSRRRGIGTALLNRLLETVLKAGGNRVFLEVRESNSEARNLYEKQGFLLVGRRKMYYSGPPEDALLFEKKFPDLSMKIR